MPRPPIKRTRRTRTEVKEEFDKIREEVAATQEAADTKSEDIARQNEAQVRQSVEGLTVETAIQGLTDLRLTISRLLSEVSEKLTAEVQRLAQVREAVALETAQIERLDKIDVATTALAQLVEEYQTRRQTLEAEITATRQQWAEEMERRARETKEAAEALKKERQRETEDYEYKKALQRKKDQDQYDEEVRKREKKNLEVQEDLDKGWQVREAALKERETELAKLKKEVDDFPARLKKEVDRAVAEATKVTEQRQEQLIALLRKDAEAEARLAELRVKSLEDLVARQRAQIDALTQQVDEAKRQVQEIAVRAIEGASGAKALSHVNQIAIEQAKGRTPQG